MAHILLVDSHNASSFVTAELLRMRGYDVHTALNAADALKCAEQFHPDLLVIDATIDGSPPEPGSCGFCLGQTIMESQKCPAIMLSSLGEPQYQEKAKRRGFARFVVKGTYAESLDAMIREVLGA